MSETIDLETFANYGDPDSPTSPSFRFSKYFNETTQNIPNKLCGEWLKKLDKDTINDFYSTLKKIDDKYSDGTIGEDKDLMRDLADILYLTLLIWQWETGEIWDVNIHEPIKDYKHVEYQYRLASLIQFEYLQRHGGKSPDERLEKDNVRNKGKLAILD